MFMIEDKIFCKLHRRVNFDITKLIGYCNLIEYNFELFIQEKDVLI